MIASSSKPVVKFRDRRLFLKIKLKSLAAEAKIIRKEEKKELGFRVELRDHRIFPVRREARHTLLAYSFLRGRPYREVENKCLRPPDWVKVEAMVRKYGAPFGGSTTQDNEEMAKVMARFKEWPKQ